MLSQQADLVEAVEWRDLLQLRKREVASELLLSLPWLAGSLLAASNRYYFIALGCSFMFFLAGLRQVHNGRFTTRSGCRAFFPITSCWC